MSPVFENPGTTVSCLQSLVIPDTFDMPNYRAFGLLLSVAPALRHLVLRMPLLRWFDQHDVDPCEWRFLEEYAFAREFFSPLMQPSASMLKLEVLELNSCDLDTVSFSMVEAVDFSTLHTLILTNCSYISTFFHLYCNLPQEKRMMGLKKITINDHGRGRCVAGALLTLGSFFRSSTGLEEIQINVDWLQTELSISMLWSDTRPHWESLRRLSLALNGTSARRDTQVVPPNSVFEDIKNHCKNLIELAIDIPRMFLNDNYIQEGDDVFELGPLYDQYPLASPTPKLNQKLSTNFLFHSTASCSFRNSSVYVSSTCHARTKSREPRTPNAERISISAPSPGSRPAPSRARNTSRMTL